MNTRRALPLLATLLLSLTARGPARGDGVEWRRDYGGARGEALEKGLPLVLDVVAKDCPWCDRLDEVTFRAPAVVAALSRQVVPVKIDAARYGELVGKLQIQSYPTLVVASPAGKILASRAGYIGPEAFLEFVRAAVGPAPTASASPAPGPAAPAWMEERYRKAAEAVARSENARAVPLLKDVLKDDRG